MSRLTTKQRRARKRGRAIGPRVALRVMGEIVRATNAMLLEGRNYQVMEIARFFGVPFSIREE